MGKDPAFLFYPGDFLVGVSDLTMEERGQYITLLCLQFEKGRLSKKNITIAVGKVSPDVLDKFTVDDNGLYYNKRLEQEVIKRQEYSKSRSQNGSKGGRPRRIEPNEKPYAFEKETICLTYASKSESIEKAQEKHTENINVDINTNNIDDSDIISNNTVDSELVIPTFQEVEEYARTRDRLDLAKPFFDYYDAGKWHDKDGKPVRKWKQKFITWESHSEKPSTVVCESTFDTDEFFQKAVERSNAKMRERLNKG